MRVHKWFITTIVAATFWLPSTSAAQGAARAKIDPSLREALASGHGTSQRVIIRIGPDVAARIAIRHALERHGDLVWADLPLLGALAGEVHADDVAELARHPWITSISSDAVVSAGSSPSPDSGHAVPALLRRTLGLMPVATAQNGSPTGAGIGVAIIDSGLQVSADFSGRLIGFYDFTRGGIPALPSDEYGHGTHVAGIIASSGLTSNFQFQGIAPRARLLVLKVLDRKGQGRTSDVVRALEFVTANRAHFGIRVVNLSLGHPVFERAATDPLVQAVENASHAGLIVVVSAGNIGINPKSGRSGYGGITSPGNAPSAITVGAETTDGTVARGDDRVALFSSRGPSWYDAYAKPDLVAPGVDLVSNTALQSDLDRRLAGEKVRAANGQLFLKLSGTSMAAGVATGVVALMLDANRRAFHADAGASPVLTHNAVKAMLQFTSVGVICADDAPCDPLTAGAGGLNAAGALALAGAVDTRTVEGRNWLASGVVAASTIGNQTLSWTQQIVWGPTLVRGSVVYVNEPAWNDNIVWGDRAMWDDASVWGADAEPGDNIVWGNNVVWGDNIVWGDRLVGTRNGDQIIWGNVTDSDNIVWGNFSDDNIVWGNNIVWTNRESDDNVVSGNNVVWGNSAAGGGSLVRRRGPGAF